MSYRIEYAKSVTKDIAKISDKNLRLIFEKIETLTSDPYPPTCKKLKGYDSLYRIRAGNYRILYEVENDVLVVFIVEIGDRKNVYED